METKFHWGQPVALTENRHVEFKEVKGPNLTRPIVGVAEKYAVSFLNSEGGRILWGIRDSDNVVVGVSLSPSDQDQIQKTVVSKLSGIQPTVDPTQFRLNFHPVEGGAAGLVVVELIVPAGSPSEPYFVSGGQESYVRVDGSTLQLSGQKLTEWIRSRLGANASHALTTSTNLMMQGVPPARSNVSPNDRGFTLNPIELMRRLRRQGNSARAEFVAERVIQLFNDHGIAVSQIPRWLPELTLADLNNNEKLLGALTPALLERAAEIFGIQRTWLEGTSHQIYSTHTCYKHPAELFRLLEGLKFSQGSFPVRALTSVKSLDYRDGSSQLLALVVVEKLADAEGVENIRDIDRYHIFGDVWDWAYFPSRIQLKGMARVIDQIIQEPVPLYIASPKEGEAVLDGRLIPRAFFNRTPITYPSLEDYGRSLAETAQAKELEELPTVIQYVASTGIEAMAQQVRKRIR